MVLKEGRVILSRSIAIDAEVPEGEGVMHHSNLSDWMDAQRSRPSLEIGCFFSVSQPISLALDTASRVKQW